MSVEVAQLRIEVDSTQVRKGTQDLDAFASKSGSAESSLKRLFAAAGVSTGIALLARQFYSVNAEFQRLQSILVTVEGGTKQAAVAFAALEKFARVTPFQLAEVTQAYTTLKARGLDATMPAMKAYGDLAGAMGVNIKDAVDGTNQALIGNTERVRGWGFTIVQQGDKVKIGLGETTRTVKKNAAEMQQAFLEIARAEFGGAAERWAKTLGGVMSNLEDAWQGLLRTIGGSGASDLLITPIQQLTEWLGRARDKVNELGQEQTFQLLIVEIGNTVELVSQLTSDISSLGGGMAEAGVKVGAFVRVLQGIQIGITAIRAIIQGTAAVYAFAIEFMAEKSVRFLEGLAKFPRLSKLMGFTPESVEEGIKFFQGLEKSANEFGDKSAESFVNAWDSMLTNMETAGEKAKAKVEAFKKALADMQGDQSGVGAARKQQTTLSESEMNKLKEARNALRDWGIEQLRSLGLIDAEQEKVEKLTEKIKILGEEKVKEVQAEAAKVQAEIQLAKELEATAALEERRRQAALQATQQDIQSAEAIRNLADPYRQYRLELQKINDLQDDGYIKTQAAADLAKAQAKVSMIPEEAKTDAQALNDELELLNAKMAAGAISSEKYKRKFIELGLSMNNFAGMVGNAIQIGFNRAEEALVKFVTTGKASFKDFVSSLLADLARMLAQKAMMQLLGMALGAWFGASSGVDMSSTTGGGGWDMASVGMAAYGSPSVSAGTPLIVGERGPELFLPGSSGSIVPNSALAGGGGSPVTITVEMNFNEGRMDSSSSSQGGSAESRRDADQLKKSFEAMMSEWVSREQRPNGKLDPRRQA